MTPVGTGNQVAWTYRYDAGDLLAQANGPNGAVFEKHVRTAGKARETWGEDTQATVTYGKCLGATASASVDVTDDNAGT